MTAVDILAAKVRESRRFRYQADDDGKGDALARLMEDRWTPADIFEARGYGDCDDFAQFAAQRGDETARDPRVQWCVVVGTVRQNGAWLGHMWTALIDEEGREWWADATWGKWPGPVEALGYPGARLPVRRWIHKGGGHFDDQADYVSVPVANATAAASAAFLTDLDIRKVARTEWELLTPLVYRSAIPEIGTLTVPAGFRTDFASVPRAPFAYLIAGNTGHEAATVHDHLYRTGSLPRALADDVFAEALAVLGEPAWRIALMWQGVRLFGESSYRARAA